jgi:hypothetical protein
MIDVALFRSMRVRSHREAVRDAGQTFRLAPGVDVRVAMKRATPAAVPKRKGWALRHFFTLERTGAGERIASVLAGLARNGMGGPDFAAAPAATLDGECAVLAVTAREARRVERVGAGLHRAGADPAEPRRARKAQQIRANSAHLAGLLTAT